jgi:hypothetical protein
MHAEVREFVKEWVSLLTGKKVLDVGGADINGTVRDLFAGWEYTCQDEAGGKGVDVAAPVSRLPAKNWDVVLCLNVLEHCRNPFELMGQLAAKSKAVVIATTPTRIDIHRHPIDAWRILPDGMRELAEQAGIGIVEIGTLPGKHADTYLVGRV